MKYFWIKLLVLCVCLLVLSGCAPETSGFLQNIPEETYPSQFLIGDLYILKENEKIDGNIAGIGITLIIKEGAEVNGNINLIGSQLEISGLVRGNINVLAGNSTVHDTARIKGNINQIIHQLDVDPQATIEGEINSYSFPSNLNGDSKNINTFLSSITPTNWILFLGITHLFHILLSFLIVFLFQKGVMQTIEEIQAGPIIAWGVGMLIFIGIPIVSVILIITICLSPLGLILLVALFVGFLWGWASLSTLIGERLSHWLKLKTSFGVQTLIGAIVLGSASFFLTFIPCIGFLIRFTIASVGIGGVVAGKLKAK